MPESEKIVKTEIKSWGHPVKDDHGKECKSCVDLDNFVKSDITPNSSIPIDYTMKDIYTDEGKKYAEDKKIGEMPEFISTMFKKPGKSPFDFSNFNWSELTTNPALYMPIIVGVGAFFLFMMLVK